MERHSAQKRQGDRNVTEPVVYCLKIGFFAGVIWGAVRWLAVAMNFTRVPQAFLVDPWVRRSALYHVTWQLVGYALFIGMSIVAAFAYYLVFRRFRGPAAGIAFGLGWWALLYLSIGPMMKAVPPLGKIGWNSLITDMCLFTVWGLFIGYSIAYEFNDDSRREFKLANV
ncbi:YqhR family membrane protein [Cohnella candidum]|uniref:YqhR family membrane protein n=1 Tax=Cohnella candidum TaxID=2674991 RepID=UPI0013DDEF6B|nr:YqhR family membrane protein [Cohnella candidum]